MSAPISRGAVYIYETLPQPLPISVQPFNVSPTESLEIHKYTTLK